MNDRELTRLMYRAYIWDGKTTHTGEAVLLACMLHAKGQSRDSEEMRDVQRIMHDHNLKRD